MRSDEDGNLLPYEDEDQEIHTISYDEKPWIQAIATTSADLPHTNGNGVTMRDTSTRGSEPYHSLQVLTLRQDRHFR